MNSFGVTMSCAILVFVDRRVHFDANVIGAHAQGAQKKPVQDGAEHHGHTSGFFRAYRRGLYQNAQVEHGPSLGDWSGLSGGAVFDAIFGQADSQELLPDDDESQFQVTARAPEGTSLEATADIARKIALDVRKQKEVAYTVITIGGSGQSAARNNASVFVRLKPIGERGEVDGKERSQADLITYARTNIVPQFAADQLRTTVGPAGGIGGGGSQGDVAYTVAGPDLDKLEEVTQKMRSSVRKLPKVVDVDSSLISGKPELNVEVNRPLAAQLGVQPQASRAGAQLFGGR